MSKHNWTYWAWGDQPYIAAYRSRERKDGTVKVQIGNPNRWVKSAWTGKTA